MKIKTFLTSLLCLTLLSGCVGQPAPVVTVTERVTEDGSGDTSNESTEQGNESIDSDITLSQENAIKSAENYLSFSAFSRKGLIGQLEFEGYSNEDATFAVDYLDVNWNAQAAKSAEQYLEFSSFSRQGLIDQLIFEGYTDTQAEYGVSAVGY